MSLINTNKTVCFNDASWNNNEFFKCAPNRDLGKIIQFVKEHFIYGNISTVKCVDYLTRICKDENVGSGSLEVCLKFIPGGICQDVAEVLGCTISESDYGNTISC